MKREKGFWVNVLSYTELMERVPYAIDLSAYQLELLLYKIDGEIYCTENRCSHRDVRICSGKLSEYLIRCPLHGALFDIRNGESVRSLGYPSIRSFRTWVDDHLMIHVWLEQ